MGMVKRRSDSRAIGARLQQVREASGLSREKVARAAGMSSLRLWRIENGETRVLAVDVAKLAKALETSVAEIYGEAA